jgi:hypothetical protein
MRGHEAACIPLCPTIVQESALSVSYEQTLPSAIMSHTHIAASSSSNFQLIINDALKAYENRTKKDLLTHPLAAQLQSCESLSAILAILQQQVQGLDQPRSDDRWTKWLDPTVNVLFSFSATVGAGVSLVNPTTCSYLRSALIFYLIGILACYCNLYWNRRSSLSVYPRLFGAGHC